MLKRYDHNKLEDYKKRVRERINEFKPTYEQLEKKQDKIQELEQRQNSLESMIKNLIVNTFREKDGNGKINPLDSKEENKILEGLYNTMVKAKK